MKIFYNENQTVSDNDSFSPSAGKPAKVAEQYSKFGRQVQIVGDFKPLTPSQIALAHDVGYVRGVLTCKESNGFGNRKKSVAKSLPWTTGSLYAGALEALKTRTITGSLTSGFHHASHNHGGGFCTFNGLVITAQLLRLRNGVKKVGIWDADQHYGDGTENIINKLGLNYIEHYTLGHTDVGPYNAEKWLQDLEGILISKFSDVDVLIYQAGADPWINDPLGGRLTKEQLRRRDEITFKVVKELGIGCVFNLAGGYADNFQQVLDIHNNTLIEAFKAIGVMPKVESATNDDVASNGERNAIKKGFVWSSEFKKDTDNMTDAELSEYIAKTLGE